MNNIDMQFIDVTELDRPDALAVLEIRNHPAVRGNMYTDHVISEDEHFRWIGRLRENLSAFFYAVVVDGDVIGGAGVSLIDRTHKRADWAFYLSPAVHGRGLGSALERKFVSFAFNEFGLEKLNCEVIDFNDSVVRMHERFGFSREGVRRKHVIRNGASHDIVLLGVTKDEWLAQGNPSYTTTPGELAMLGE